MAMMSAMFRSEASSAILAALALSGCGPDTPDAVVAAATDAGAAWPLMLRHCLALPACDPMSDFGTGEGEASGYVGSTAWHAQSQGAIVSLALYGQRGSGGKAGRPLSIDELPDNLGGAKAKRSTLAIEYRMTADVLAPYALQFISPHLTQLPDGLEAARLDIVGAGGVLFSATARGTTPPPTPVNGNWRPPPSMVFHVTHDLRTAPLAALLTAIASGETLSVKLVAPGGEVMLQDALYTDGYEAARTHASAAFADPELARSIPERCARFAAERDDFWKVADVTPALLACDPRLPEMRR
jgi:hypothetical protein